MQNGSVINHPGLGRRSAPPGALAKSGSSLEELFGISGRLPRNLVVGLILIIALLAFEVFNFDTTRYALRNLLGDVNFLTVEWATILAIAFCSIDFAGLVRLFTPDTDEGVPKEVWYLMGAWLLGATMNAMMTWWAVSLTLLNHDFGNEVLSREQLLYIVPIFVAVLVWLTRILFIGAFTVAGNHIFDWSPDDPKDPPETPRRSQVIPAVAPQRARPAPQPAANFSDDLEPLSDELPGFLNGRSQERSAPRSQSESPIRRRPAVEETREPARERPARSERAHNDRLRQRPPIPASLSQRPAANGVQARARRQG